MASFETAIKESQPWTVMCSYNKVNGEYCSENPTLLTDVLRSDWGYEGFVISDWDAVNDRDKGLQAGLELQMPGDNGVGDALIVKAVKEGRLNEEVLDTAVERILNITFKAIENKKENVTYSKEDHHELARKIASECIVLLKNDDSILPLKKNEKIAVIGELAKKIRYQGSGSSLINPTKLDNTYEELVKLAGEEHIIYTKGYNLNDDDLDATLVEEAKKVASEADKVVLFIGLPDRYESEGFDRVHLNIPENQAHLVNELKSVNENIIVVLNNGSPIVMPFVNNVKGIIEGYLTGQGSGKALADIIYGEINPSGKLAETFPIKLSDTPSFLNFPGEADKVEYKEGIFVGYRYYDKKEMDVLFPFGHGLSYTNFEYTGIELSSTEINDTDKLNVTVRVKNTGDVFGKETVQLYVRDVHSSVIRPEKELKGFEKIALNPGEEKTVSFELDKRSFAYYNTDISDWHVETGDFEILIGKSSRDIILKELVKVNSTVDIKIKVHKNTSIADISHLPEVKEILDDMIAEFGQDDQGAGDMLTEMLKYMPLRTIVAFDPEHGEAIVERILSIVNKNN